MENKEVWIVVLVLGAVLLFNNNNYATGKAATGGPGFTEVREQYEQRYLMEPPVRRIPYDTQERNYNYNVQPQPIREMMSSPRGSGFSPYYYEPGSSPTGSGYAPQRLPAGSSTQPPAQYPNPKDGDRRWPGQGVSGQNTGSLQR